MRVWLPTPAIDTYLQLAYALGCETELPRLELATLATDEAAAGAAGIARTCRQAIRSSCSIPAVPSAAKLWPSEYFAGLARRIVDEQGLSVLVLCGPAERNVARQIVELAGHPKVVSLAGEQLSIGLSKACVRRSRMLVTTDSGPRFFAVAFEVPVISLFGPTDIGWTRTHYAGETCLQHAVPCGPCAAAPVPWAITIACACWKSIGFTAPCVVVSPQSLRRKPHE